MCYRKLINPIHEHEQIELDALKSGEACKLADIEAAAADQLQSMVPVPPVRLSPAFSVAALP
jgi:hypothetical protein